MDYILGFHPRLTIHQDWAGMAKVPESRNTNQKKNSDFLTSMLNGGLAY